MPPPRIVAITSKSFSRPTSRSARDGDHAMHARGEVVVQRPAVDVEVPGAGDEPYASHGFLAASGGDLRGGRGHLRLLFVLLGGGLASGGLLRGRLLRPSSSSRSRSSRSSSCGRRRGLLRGRLLRGRRGLRRALGGGLRLGGGLLRLGLRRAPARSSPWPPCASAAGCFSGRPSQTGGSPSVYGTGLLGLVRMLGAGDHVELLDHRAPQPVLREHAPHRLLDHELRACSRSSRVVPGPRDPARDTRSGGTRSSSSPCRRSARSAPALMTMTWSPTSMCGREDRLVLAAQDGRDLRGQTSEHQAAGVDHVPAAHDVLGLRRVGLHTWKIGRADRPMGNATCGNAAPSKLAPSSTIARPPSAAVDDALEREPSRGAPARDHGALPRLEHGRDIRPGSSLPSPTRTSVPTSVRTIWCRNALARKPNVTDVARRGPSDSRCRSPDRRPAGPGCRQNDAKSCSPTRCRAAARIRAMRELARAGARRTGRVNGSAHRRRVDHVAVLARRGREPRVEPSPARARVHDDDLGRQEPFTAAGSAPAQGAGRRERRDLPTRVDARVRPPRHGEPDVVPHDPRERRRRATPRRSGRSGRAAAPSRGSPCRRTRA